MHSAYPGELGEHDEMRTLGFASAKMRVLYFTEQRINRNSSLLIHYAAIEFSKTLGDKLTRDYGSKSNILIIILAAFATINSSTAQWARTIGPYGGPVGCLATNSKNLYAGSSYGLFLSTNNGLSWTAVNLPDNSVNALAVSDTNLFAGTPSGVFLSTDNGANWTSVSSGLALDDYGVRSIVVSGTKLFAATFTSVYVSTNNGMSWISISPGLSFTQLNFLALSDTDLFAGCNNGMYLFQNSDSSWVPVNNGLAVSGLATVLTAFAASGTDLFAGTFDTGLYFSTNNGKSWAAADSGLTSAFIGALAVSGTNIYAGTDKGVFVSTNKGTSWIPASSGLTDNNVMALAICDTVLFAGTFESGVFASANNGLSWNAVNTGLTDPYSNCISALAISGTDLFAAASLDVNDVYGGGIFLSTNDGSSWDELGLERYIGPNYKCLRHKYYCRHRQWWCTIFRPTMARAGRAPM